MQPNMKGTETAVEIASKYELLRQKEFIGRHSVLNQNSEAAQEMKTPCVRLN